MSKVNSIRSGNGIGHVQSTNLGQTGFNASRPISFREKFYFPFSEEIKLNQQNHSQIVNLCDRPNYNVLTGLFTKAINDKIIIIATNPRNYGDYVVEASFMPAGNKQQFAELHLPLRGVENKVQLISLRDLQGWIDAIFNASTDEEISRLIVVTAHEYGHFLSWQRGNHDRELSNGLYLMNHKMVNSGFDNLFAVFREECIAWRMGKDKLQQVGFDEFSLYRKVQRHSLDSYFKILNLKQAPNEVYYKLSYYMNELQ